MAATCRFVIVSLFITGFAFSFATSARIRRALETNGNGSRLRCLSGTITERNKTSSVILTGTVTDCDKVRVKGMYSCRIQVWTIMKGRNLTSDLLIIPGHEFTDVIFPKTYVMVHGLGNSGFCQSEVRKYKTRTFFLNKVEGRLVLSASLLRVTLKNLEDTENVINGIEIEESPTKAPDPCFHVVCGYGAKCESTASGTATCVCPTITCGKTPGYSDVFAPVCGSDGVTYPSQCRLKAQECWQQKRIRIKSNAPCAPISQSNPCEDMECGNSAQCAVVDGAPKCQCPTCDDAIVNLVCGSDQITYLSECELQRAACVGAKEIEIVRRTPCDPCVLYNETSQSMDRVCNGPCSLNEEGEPLCCDDIPCPSTNSMMICGSDGRTYMSKCALERYICKSGKNVTEVSAGSCPSGMKSTMIRGSASILADDKCPGNCQIHSPEFANFTEHFERAVVKSLQVKNEEDVDARKIVEFEIHDVRSASAVFVYSARITWFDEPIHKDFQPGDDSTWAYQRLHDPNNGVFATVINAMGVVPATHDPMDDFVTEEVCGSMQCSYGAACKLTKDDSGGFLYDCDCSVIGDFSRLPVTLGCKIANNKHFYDNKIAAKGASCLTKTILTFTDSCSIGNCVGKWRKCYDDPPPNPCDDLKCGAGSTCVVTDNVTDNLPSCECSTCQQQDMPVCGSNQKTYRNLCELERENCLQQREQPVTVKSEGMCESQCDDIDCGYGGQCEELPHKSAQCFCPTDCVEVYAPVCGSDGVTYENDCKMMIASCNKKVNITVDYRNTCVPGVVLPPASEDHLVDEHEGSGASICRFGAVYETTIDDEDERCVCDITCESSDTVLCGSDGVTYFGECEIRKARCEKQQDVTVVDARKCPEPCSESTFGCCQDGITHAKGSRKTGCPETCQCNEHGSFSPICNHVNGQCTCRPGVTGLHCDECSPGYWNFKALTGEGAVGCMRCQCEADGSIRDDCDAMTGQCTCKEGVTGTKCSVCENGGTLTKAGCVEDIQPQTAASCEELTCHSGKECVEVLGDSMTYECRCPDLSSCNDFPNKQVCASSGVTYTNECYMRIMGCREGKELYVVSAESCERYYRSFGPVIPPLVEPTITTSTVPAHVTESSQETTSDLSMTTTPTMDHVTTTAAQDITETTIAWTSELEEGSGDEHDNGNVPTDDEDGLNIYSSGQEPPPTDVKVPPTKGSMSTYLVHVTFMSIDGMDLVHSYDTISSDPEMLAQLKTSVIEKVKDTIKGMPNNGGVDLTSLKNVVILPSTDGGVTAQLEMDISSHASLPEIEDFVNSSLHSNEIFMITKQVKPKDKESEYVEDGTWKIPQFGGASFLEFAKIDAYSSVTIEMTFKSVDDEGLLLYDGQTAGQDFISLTIINRCVEFRFDTGSGALALRSTVPVNDGRSHTLIARRNRREGMLKVDEEQAKFGTSPSSTTGVNLDTRLFIGGCPSNMEERIAECGKSPCMPNPCSHSSKCLITYQLEEFTFKCDCGSRYYGTLCDQEASEDVCASNPCHSSSTCLVDQESYRCLCPESREGRNCTRLLIDEPLQNPIAPSYMPMFAGDSYIERPPLIRVGTQLDIEVVFYTYQLEGLIFYTAQSDTGVGDYIALNIRNGYLDFMYDLGLGAVHIMSNTKVTLNQWHTAVVSRIKTVGDLVLDDNPKVKGQSPDNHTQLNVAQSLYIGAVPESITLPKGTSITSGLMGAIQKFVVNGFVFPRSLMDDESSSYHVKAFNGHPCYREPCQNNGSCVPFMGNYSCQCKPGFSGPTCDTVEDIAQDMPMDLNFGSALYLDGNVKAIYNNHITRKLKSRKHDHYEFEFKTTSSNGLILYNGKASRRGEYIAVAISQGQIHFVYDLGSGSSNIVSGVLVNDGTWQKVTITRNGNEASLQVNNSPRLTNTGQTIAKSLHSDGILWIGGCAKEKLLAQHRSLPKSFRAGFIGCLRNFRINGQPLRLQEDVLNRPGFSICENR